jgi:hypothetical protein
LEDFGIGRRDVSKRQLTATRERKQNGSSPGCSGPQKNATRTRYDKRRQTKKFDGCLRIERSPASLQDAIARLLEEAVRNGEGKMNTTMRVVAMPTEVANAVRSSLQAPVYGFPAHVETAADAAPCRHCLKTFVAGKDRRILFTYDRFAGVESLPQPGPVYIHADNCARYDGDSGFPEELRGSPRTLEAYAQGRKLIATEYVADGKYEVAIEKLFANQDAAYIQVNSTTAGCFTFRIERAGA